MDLKSKKVGIWGFGIVGKSALSYFTTKKSHITIMDTRPLSLQEQYEIKKSGATFINQSEDESFLEENEIILASPGIDLHNYSQYHHKFITELDLFAQENTKPIIAITGTIGKTSITDLLSKIIQTYEPLSTGGNIGVGMLNLLKQSDAKKVVLEVSSFQLEQCKLFAPDLAIWTNFYPNHLDRHRTLEEYFRAKYSILKYQKENQNALIPLELASQIVHEIHQNQGYKGTLHFFSHTKPCLHTYTWLPKNSNLFWIEDSTIVHYCNNKKKELLSLKNLSKSTFEKNWLIVAAALEIMDLSQDLIFSSSIVPLEHRVEKISENNQILIYNDSKSTIMESTLAAVEKLQGNNIILFLGGFSKGVDRKISILQLADKVKQIICFGAEAQQLHEYAQCAAIPSNAFATLETAVHYALKQAQSGDQILFSPGGSSYDLFKNFEERGAHFKQLVDEYNEKSNQ